MIIRRHPDSESTFTIDEDARGIIVAALLDRMHRLGDAITTVRACGSDKAAEPLLADLRAVGKVLDAMVTVES